MNSDNRLMKITLWISISLYVLSLFFSGFSTSGIQKNDDIGLFLVLFGWYDVFGGNAGYTWLANPVLWGAWLVIRDPKKSFVFGLIASTIMLLFAFSRTIKSPVPCGSWLESSDCPHLTITKLYLGYYLWIASAIVSVSGNSFRILSVQSRR